MGVDVHIHRQLPIVFWRLDDACSRPYPSVGKKQVDLPELLHRLLNERFVASIGADVSVKGHGARKGCSNVASISEVGQHDVGATCVKLAGERFTNASSCTRDDDVLSLQLHGNAS